MFFQLLPNMCWTCSMNLLLIIILNHPLALLDYPNVNPDLKKTEPL